MQIQEFSHQFDTLLSSYAISPAFGHADSPASIRLDEYEKSLFLTNAQEEVALSLYNGRNSFNLSFEETEELRRYLSNLVREADLEPISTTNGMPLGIDSTSKFFTLPSDLWFITYESVNLSEGKCEGHTSMQAVPVTQDEYHRIKKNPFRGANDRRALRLDLSDNVVEIVCKYPVKSYYIRYLKQLEPIILTQLEDDTQLRGKVTPRTSELPEILHLRILDRAVQLVLQSRGLGIQSQNNRQNNNRE